MLVWRRPYPKGSCPHERLRGIHRWAHRSCDDPNLSITGAASQMGISSRAATLGQPGRGFPGVGHAGSEVAVATMIPTICAMPPMSRAISTSRQPRARSRNASCLRVSAGRRCEGGEEVPLGSADPLDPLHQVVDRFGRGVRHSGPGGRSSWHGSQGGCSLHPPVTDCALAGEFVDQGLYRTTPDPASC